MLLLVLVSVLVVVMVVVVMESLLLSVSLAHKRLQSHSVHSVLQDIKRGYVACVTLL